MIWIVCKVEREREGERR